MHPLASRVCFFCAGLQDFLQNVLRSFGQALWDIQGTTLTNFVVLALAGWAGDGFDLLCWAPL